MNVERRAGGFILLLLCLPLFVATIGLSLIGLTTGNSSAVVGGLLFLPFSVFMLDGIGRGRAMIVGVKPRRGLCANPIRTTNPPIGWEKKHD